jgi:hypothetical protein
VTHSDLECLKANIDRVVEIETRGGEHFLAKVISVFDQESDPDLFYWDVTANPHMQDSEHSQGYSIQLDEIAAVRKFDPEGGRA